MSDESRKHIHAIFIANAGSLERLLRLRCFLCHENPVVLKCKTAALTLERVWSLHGKYGELASEIKLFSIKLCHLDHENARLMLSIVVKEWGWIADNMWLEETKGKIAGPLYICKECSNDIHYGGIVRRILEGVYENSLMPQPNGHRREYYIDFYRGVKGAAESLKDQFLSDGHALANELLDFLKCIKSEKDFGLKDSDGNSISKTDLNWLLEEIVKRGG